MSRRLLFFLVTGLILYYILSRLRIVVLIHLSLWQGLLAVAVMIIVLFLLLDHLINRNRGNKDEDE
ncbi:MAG: hypothetical protein JXA10_14955 [Anaerolineae bacterium]|nr:hypothetical protein [Anaerolineae bacterium]